MNDYTPTEEERMEAKKNLSPLLEYLDQGYEGPLPEPPPDDPEPKMYVEHVDRNPGGFGPMSGDLSAIGGRIVKTPNPEWHAWAARNGKADAPVEVGTVIEGQSGQSVFAVAQQIERVLPEGAQMEARGNQIIITL